LPGEANAFPAKQGLGQQCKSHPHQTRVWHKSITSCIGYLYACDILACVNNYQYMYDITCLFYRIKWDSDWYKEQHNDSCNNDFDSEMMLLLCKF